MDKAKIAALLAAATLASASFFVGRSMAGGVPADAPLVYSGTLEGANGPLSDSRNIEIKLWGKAKAHLCTTLPQRITLVNGHFSLELPPDCADAVSNEPDVEVEVLVNGDSIGRTKLGAVPYALQAGRATTAERASTADNAVNASTAKGALDDRIKAVETSAVAIERFAWGYFQEPQDLCQPVANLRQDGGTNILLRASLWLDDECKVSANTPDGVHAWCAAQHFTERADNAYNCARNETYYTNGLAEVLVIKPVVQASP